MHTQPELTGNYGQRHSVSLKELLVPMFILNLFEAVTYTYQISKLNYLWGQRFQ
jgi:hypothetical protein